MGSTIVLIEDEASIREIVRGYLEREGHTVHVSGKGREGLELAERVNPALVVLDLMLPDMAGEQVCARIRRRSDVPILILTAKAAEADLVHGFRLGADDYLTKPFSPRELVARVRAILRRTGAREMPLVDEVSVGDGQLVIDTAIGEVRFDESIIELTTSEYRLIEALARYPGRVYSRHELLDALQDDETYSDSSERVIDAHVKNLRRKIEPDPSGPRYILTAHGTGYRLARHSMTAP